MHTSSQKVNTEDKIQLLSVVWEVLDAHVSGLSALFANDRDKQLVLAFNSIQTGEISFEKCNQLTQSLIAISQSNHYNLSFTGYLNGAQLAEYCNYLCSGIIETKAVLFNSPGITKKHDPKNLVNYLGKPNIFNSLNSHNGKIYRLFTLAEDDSVRFQYLNVLKQKHGDHLYENMKNCDFILESIIELSDPIERLNKILDQFDADTGKPFYCEEVKGWPLLKINPAKFYQTTLVSSLIDQKRLTFSRNDSIKSRKELIKEAMKKESIDRRNSKLGSKEHLAEKNRFSSFRDSVLSRKKPNDKEKKKDSKMSQSSRISGLLNNLKSKQNKKERKNSESSLSHNSIGSPVPNQNSPTLSTYTQEDNFQEEIKYPEVLYNIEYILKIVNELIKELFEFVSFEKETYTLKIPKNEEAKTYEAEFLHFINDYQTEKVDWFEDLMNIEYPNNDWCLNALTDFNIDSISSEECKQLMEIIVSDYSIKKKENSFLIVSHLLSIESIRNKMTRLKLLMPELPELMSNSANKENFSRIRNNLELMEYQFVGREAIIQRCKFLLERDQGIIINGESGTGKTRLANQLGIMFKKDYIVRVMNSESSDKLEKDYREFAELLLKMNSKVNDISMLVQMVNSKLRSHHFNFIFIFDNMTDWNLVSFFLVDLPFHKVNVIITTKYPELTTRWAPICLEPFDTNESNEYLINNIYQPLTQQQNNEIIRLAKLNDEKVLPIELYLTARYINEYLTEDIRTFLKSFEAERSIYHMLAAKLRKESLESFQLFKYCCHMDADFISFSLLKHLTSTDIS
jgi:energy-coupling factor transporter ATP-binding protein EcfA2